MLAEKRSLIQQIDAARTAIEVLFIEHCSEGAQTKVLQNDSVAACGQFIGVEARAVAQRGLHGTSAALQVLSQASTTGDGSTLVPRLTKYLTDRDAIELQLRKSLQGVDSHHRAADANNVIKLSEVLHALAGVPESVDGSGELKRRLVHVLKSNLIEKKGWPYFLDTPQGGPELLPTAYAVLALSAVGERLEGPIRYLAKQLQEADSTTSAELSRDGADINIRVACLYALTFRKDGDRDSVLPEGEVRRLFDHVWSALEPLLRQESVEQNIEYWRGPQTYYVRIPWQLYLIALAVRLRYYRCFATFAAQTRLMHVIGLAKSGRFAYPHSGNMISSRTNAIAYETLGQVLAEVRRDRGIAPSFFYVCDRVRRSIWLRRVVGLAASLLILVSLALWAKQGAGLSELAPGFATTGVLTLIALWTQRR